jgi:sirohydrochlorin ferrochelatase
MSDSRPALAGETGAVVSTWFNISIALIVFMGIAGGGMLTLVLMSNKRQQFSFTVMLVLVVLIALLGVTGSVLILNDPLVGLTNAVILLVLSFTLGYALTTFSVLGNPRKRPALQPSGLEQNRAAVILYAPGETPEYDTRSAARRLELADDPHDVPPLLLRPFYMRDIRTKYSLAGQSPFRESHIELAGKVQSRLSSHFVVTPAFYSDTPSLADVLSRAVEDGYRDIVVAHVRVTDPPDPVLAGDTLEGINLDRYGIRLRHTEPLWDSQLLPQIYVRRLLEAIPTESPDGAEAGLLLVGRGHFQGGESSVARFTQESNFLRRMRDAAVRVGFSETRIAIGWLRHAPNAADALQSLVNTGCRVVYCAPATFAAEGINTLYDIPAQVEPVVKASGVRFVPLGAWNADDLAAEEIAAYVRAEMPERAAPARMSL